VPKTGAKKCIHILHYYGSNMYEVCSKDGVNQMNASITMQQAGQKKNGGSTIVIQGAQYHYNFLS
jgi:hypothetical protein